MKDLFRGWIMKISRLDKGMIPKKISFHDVMNGKNKVNYGCK